MASIFSRVSVDVGVEGGVAERAWGEATSGSEGGTGAVEIENILLSAAATCAVPLLRLRLRLLPVLSTALLPAPIDFLLFSSDSWSFGVVVIFVGPESHTSSAAMAEKHEKAARGYSLCSG